MTIEMDIAGMSCGHCVSALTSELAALPGIGSLEVSVGHASFQVGAEVTDEVLRAAVVEAGFDVTALRRS